MYKIRIFSILSLLILFLNCGDKNRAKESNKEQQPAEAKKNNSDDDIKYINQMRKDIEDAETTPNDIETLRKYSAPDIVLIPEGMAPIIGRENALNSMKQMWDALDVKIEYHSEEVKIVGDIAIDRGWAKQISTDKKTGKSVSENDSYLWISQRNNEGVWKQVYITWNNRPQ